MTEPSVRLIAETTAEYYEFKYTELLSQRRAAPLVRARHVAFALSRRLTSKTFPSIGRVFGRDHTTVIHGCLAIEEAARNDAGFAAELAEIEVAIEIANTSGRLISIIRMSDGEPRDIASRILEDDRGVTAISVEDLRVLAAAVMAAPELDEAPAMPSADEQIEILGAAREYLAAVTNERNASFGGTSLLRNARIRREAAEVRMARAISNFTPTENAHHEQLASHR